MATLQSPSAGMNGVASQFVQYPSKKKERNETEEGDGKCDKNRGTVKPMQLNDLVI